MIILKIAFVSPLGLMSYLIVEGAALLVQKNPPKALREVHSAVA